MGVVADHRVERQITFMPLWLAVRLGEPKPEAAERPPPLPLAGGPGLGYDPGTVLGVSLALHSWSAIERRFS